MSMNSFIFFLCVICVSAVEYQPILFQISSKTSYCNDEKLFRNFDLGQVSQFGAMCNIPSPKSSQIEFLLENNVVPILCMGLYDVFLRICKSASDDILPFKDIFPPTTEKFTKLFNELDQWDNYSSLETFCSSTVNNYTITDPASNVTELWWNELNHQLKNKNTCENICHTNEKNKVHPLCSYIIWSNGVYLNHLKSQAESQSTAVVSGENQLNFILETNLDSKKVVDKPNEIMSSAGDNQLYLSPTVQIMESDYPADSLYVEVSKSNTSAKLIGAASGSLGADSGNSSVVLGNSLASLDKSRAPSPHSGAILAQSKAISTHSVAVSAHIGANLVDSEKPVTPQESAAAKPEQDKSSAPGTNKTETKTSENSELKPNNRVEKVKKKYLKNKTPVLEKTPNPPEGRIGEGLKTDAENLDVTKQQSDDQTKTNAENTVDAVIEGDFSFEMTPDGTGIYQPIGADPKDLQPPYTDEETEDGDGDDVDLEPEGPVKTTSNANTSSKTSSSAFHDQGMEPDKVYSEVDREIIIEDHFIEAEDSHFFTYFLCMAVLTIIAYLVFHNKKKLVALAVEGRRTRGSRRRPNCSNYSKLDCSLEEAMVSNTTASVTHVLY